MSRKSANICISASRKLLRIYKVMLDHFGPQSWWPGDSPFEVMVGAILTQNTNWQNVERAMKNIKKAKLLSPRKMLARRNSVPELIRPAGFFRQKSKTLVSFLRYFVNKYEGDQVLFRRKHTSTIRKELLSINGIGCETADSILLYALDRPVFVVDTYTRRIGSRHGIIDADLAYCTLQSFFQKHLPRSPELYNEYHALLVKTGKTYCRKNEPLCVDCPLNNI